MDSFLDKSVGLFPLTNKQKNPEEPQADDTLEDTSAVVVF